MKIITDNEGKMAIESLCHSTIINTPREHFINNLAWITKLLSCIEIEKEEPIITDEPLTPGP